VKEELAEIGRTFARSIRDSFKAQLQLKVEVASLVATSDSDLEARADALLDEHHRDPEYLAHLRKAVTSKLERERRLVQHLREDADQENPERPTEEDTFDKLVRLVKDSFISSRERKVSRLERLKSLLDEPGLAYDPGELPARGDDLIGLDPEPDVHPPIILIGGTEQPQGPPTGRSWNELKRRLPPREDLEEPDETGDADERGE
jgi:hypothetical protein